MILGTKLKNQLSQCLKGLVLGCFSLLYSYLYRFISQFGISALEVDSEVD